MSRLPLEKPLTPRQYQIVGLLATGLTQRAIADRLGICSRTVYKHVELAAHKIPGRMPPSGKLVAWWHGAARRVLCGPSSGNHSTR